MKSGHEWGVVFDEFFLLTMAKIQLSERAQNFEPVPTYVRMYFVRARFAVNR